MTDFLINNKTFIMLIILIVCDLITGFIKGIKKKKLKSSIMRNGGFKKILIIIVVVVSKVIDCLFLGSEILFNITMTYYIINEMISILENVGQCGVPIPTKLKSILENLKKED